MTSDGAQSLGHWGKGHTGVSKPTHYKRKHLSRGSSHLGHIRKSWHRCREPGRSQVEGRSGSGRAEEETAPSQCIFTFYNRDPRRSWSPAAFHLVGRPGVCSPLHATPLRSLRQDELASGCHTSWSIIQSQPYQKTAAFLLPAPRDAPVPSTKPCGAINAPKPPPGV